MKWLEYVQQYDSLRKSGTKLPSQMNDADQELILAATIGYAAVIGVGMKKETILSYFVIQLVTNKDCHV